MGSGGSQAAHEPPLLFKWITHASDASFLWNTSCPLQHPSKSDCIATPRGGFPTADMPFYPLVWQDYHCHLLVTPVCKSIPINPRPLNPRPLNPRAAQPARRAGASGPVGEEGH